ncbi:hypothetical protein LH991_09710 [Schleiferilactobacillus harbinensis]|nr:hypothetical protein [Schleiferilactobacillus harbinensis]QFR22684.1 hypothetical protein D1010_04105 [Schleiferilactobacillus harbinensis]QFR64223.1 hypothetical protein LH991_09710 [Schleiferilactobacillus harbinensis]
MGKIRQYLVHGAIFATVALAAWLVFYCLDVYEGDATGLELFGVWLFVGVSGLLWLAVLVNFLRKRVHNRENR